MEWITEADGVFRGGGVKGLGLAGALIGFAEHPSKPVRRWVDVAGASAGAIIASYLATGHDARDMGELLKRTEYPRFMDYGPLGRVQAPWNLVLRRGLCHGRYFEDWFDEQLDGKTFSSVKTRDGRRYRLKLITVDVANREMIVLPDDLLDASGNPRYIDPKTKIEIVPDTLRIARAARMSMSIPYVFRPIVLRRVDGKKAMFVDGGTLSNFPVWLFDVERDAVTRPTFGFTLEGGRGVASGVGRLVGLLPWAAHFGLDIVQTAMQAWDKRFVSHSTRVRTVTVNAGAIGTTQFNLSDEQRDGLIESGRSAATRFLDAFDLSDYMNTFGRRLGDAALPTGGRALQRAGA